jgi:hypothetical protein
VAPVVEPLADHAGQPDRIRGLGALRSCPPLACRARARAEGSGATLSQLRLPVGTSLGPSPPPLEPRAKRLRATQWQPRGGAAVERRDPDSKNWA